MSRDRDGVKRPSVAEVVLVVAADLYVAVPVVGWGWDLLHGQVVDVTGMTWFLWLTCYTGVVSWSAILAYRWRRGR